MKMFSDMLLEIHTAIGNRSLGQETHPLESYHWKIVINGETLFDEECSAWDYLCDIPHEHSWSEHDMHVYDTLVAANKDILLVGGGSGRFAKAMEAVGIAAHCIDINPEAITLMTARGVSCELMDGNDMTFSDNSYPLVLLAEWAFDSSSPQTIIDESARVASERVIVSGWIADENEEDPVEYTETMTRNSESETRTATSYRPEHVIALFESAGMTVDKHEEFIAALDRDGWILGARF